MKYFIVYEVYRLARGKGATFSICLAPALLQRLVLSPPSGRDMREARDKFTLKYFVPSRRRFNLHSGFTFSTAEHHGRWGPLLLGLWSALVPALHPSSGPRRGDLLPRPPLTLHSGPHSTIGRGRLFPANQGPQATLDGGSGRVTFPSCGLVQVRAGGLQRKTFKGNCRLSGNVRGTQAEQGGLAGREIRNEEGWLLRLLKEG